MAGGPAAVRSPSSRPHTPTQTHVCGTAACTIRQHALGCRRLTLSVLHLRGRVEHPIPSLNALSSRSSRASPHEPGRSKNPQHTVNAEARQSIVGAQCVCKGFAALHTHAVACRWCTGQGAERAAAQSSLIIWGWGVDTPTHPISRHPRPPSLVMNIQRGGGGGALVGLNSNPAPPPPEVMPPRLPKHLVPHFFWGRACAFLICFWVCDFAAFFSFL